MISMRPAISMAKPVLFGDLSPTSEAESQKNAKLTIGSSAYDIYMAADNANNSATMYVRFKQKPRNPLAEVAKLEREYNESIAELSQRNPSVKPPVVRFRLYQE